MRSCIRTFYSAPRILRRLWGNLWRRRRPLIALVANLSYRGNARRSCEAHAAFEQYLDNRHERSYPSERPQEALDR